MAKINDLIFEIKNKVFQCCQSYGVNFIIASDNEIGLEFLIKSLPINVFISDKDDEVNLDFKYSLIFNLSKIGNEWEFSLNNQKIWSNQDEILVAGLIESFIRLKIAELSTEYTFVHAGVVVFNGKLILLPGQSRAGKSTLVKILLEKGGEYLSDEYALIDDTGNIEQYPKPLSLRETFYGRQTDFALSDFGFRVYNGEPLLASLIIFTSYAEDAVWNPSELGKAEAVINILAHTVSARNQPQKALRRLSAAVYNAECIKSPRNDGNIVAEWIQYRLN